MREREMMGPEDTGFDRHIPGMRPTERIRFPGCDYPTVGVELEVSLLDLENCTLAPRAPEVLERLADDERFKPELFRTIIEINTGVCRSIAEVRADLESRLKRLHEVCDEMGIGCVCIGTHPSADWRTLPTMDDIRYDRLLHIMRWPAKRLLICGVHVHVGVKSGEHAVALLNSMTVFIPHLLALSASSPYWMGKDTGLASARIKIFEGLPTAGLPPRVENWREFVQLMRTLLTANTIASIREIWWDVRPHPGFGTIEIRICDGINTLTEVCAVAALVQCLVSHLQEAYDNGEALPLLRDWTLRENKWRAARFGPEARLIRNERGSQTILADHIHDWLEMLVPTAKRLACSEELMDVGRMMAQGTNARRQRKLVESTGSFEGMLRALMEEFKTDEPAVMVR